MAYNQNPGGQYYAQQQYGSNVPYQDQGQYQNQYQNQYPQQPQQQHHAPQGGPSTGGMFDSSWHSTVDGISYSITNRDTNAMLNVRIPRDVVIRSKPGAMIQMTPTILLQGKIKFSMKKLFTGSQLAESTYTGPGEVSLAPTLFGDISAIPVRPDEGWNLGKEAFLACTSGVVRDTKSQSLGKAFFSGEDLFIYHISGQGTLWVTSFGAIVARDLQPNEQHIVDNGHLVAWNCQYAIERAGRGGMDSVKTGEGLVCRFTGPGRIYIQSRNHDEFGEWVASRTSSS
ncbi:uncharacterized protein Z520_06134 [Fonsecaea multimorphosa CBS 102226]|uniref:Altered inheritance of mitochondria protein 24, mitochondrial n=1 Tax=Fonsecaea multimorphosa CBS 102226 TaxID=1442371 RepID=A0A0D2H867_9EURO|nr:uncharacterized protein Z520_06134 [Fonsecaea multimorphosa CBS 102226]KIX98055.1 hypothetical protein Z520_06134 [Fonsecaea multimorphosa CBS 102226]OAL24421.1 hypothetical protein AYO22_05797 [Fonsecaea multimorphosa]